MKKRLTALGLTAGLLGGGAAGLALGVPGLSSAQTGGTDSTTTTAPATAPATPKPDRSAWIQQALAPLVTAGKITQAQADAVAQALQNAKPAPGPGHGPGGRLGIGPGLEAAAKAIGVTTDELRQALAGGQTIAGFAQSKNVDPKTVIDALVAETKTHLDAAVAAGKLTQAQADTELANATARITTAVTSTTPDLGGHPGRGPKANRPAPSTTTTTTG
jgi:hypothetical protein